MDHGHNIIIDHAAVAADRSTAPADHNIGDV